MLATSSGVRRREGRTQWLRILPSGLLVQRPEVFIADLCAVAYARSFPYDAWRGSLIVIVNYGWKEWIDGNQDSG